MQPSWNILPALAIVISQVTGSPYNIDITLGNSLRQTTSQSSSAKYVTLPPSFPNKNTSLSIFRIVITTGTQLTGLLTKEDLKDVTSCKTLPRPFKRHVTSVAIEDGVAWGCYFFSDAECEDYLVMLQNGAYGQLGDLSKMVVNDNDDDIV